MLRCGRECTAYLKWDYYPKNIGANVKHKGIPAIEIYSWTLGTQIKANQIHTGG
ncbi:hypothetical protein ACHAW6_014502 [Cyclotella cf. meneghiniana]